MLTGVVSANDGIGKMFVIGKAGTIDILKDGKLYQEHFLGISNKVKSDHMEQGLLGVAFPPPNYMRSGSFFVYYTNLQGDIVLSRFSVSANSDQADPATEHVVLKIEKQTPFHNGGQIAFGPDKYLYVGVGDDSENGDEFHHAQDTHSLLGKILRIDVNSLPYTIPFDNPFANQSSSRPEIWAYGFRNPWRFSFDRLTGDLYVADVGHHRYEEIDFLPSAGKSGLNHGWPIMEGLHCFPDAEQCSNTGLISPATEYAHADTCASVVAGYVYRGKCYPALHGIYFFADFCTGAIYGMSRDANG